MRMVRRQYSTTFALLSALLILPVQVVIADGQKSNTVDKPTRVIVAKVNGQPIFEDQLEARIQKNLRKDKRSGAPDSPDNFPAIKKALQVQALNEQIATELFYQAGQQLNIPDADKKIAAEITKHKAAFIANQQKIDDETIKTYVSRKFYVNEYMVANDLINPQVPEAELKTYYEETKQGYASETDTVHVQHILIKMDEKNSATAQDQAHKKIEHAQQLILDGAAFTKVAKEHSQDANAGNGGDLGYIKPGYMPPEFEKQAFSMKPGEISGIIKTLHGYHLLKVVDIKPKGSLPKYENVKEFFGKYLSNELVQKKVPAHVQQLRDKAKIEIFLSQGQSTLTPPLKYNQNNTDKP